MAERGRRTVGGKAQRPGAGGEGGAGGAAGGRRAGGHYRNFRVAVYATARDVIQMGDIEQLKSRWDAITRQVKIDKIYLETHRDLVVVDEPLMQRVKEFFQSRGVQSAGGITYTTRPGARFVTYCYSDPELQRKATEVAQYTARLFDEIILDDFFFTNCKCDKCIAAKGDRSWTQFRLEQMRDAAQNLVVGPAKAARSDVKVIIKYPNWYEHFQGLGFDLEMEPQIFDGIYTGTETRHPFYNPQHLQQYLGYSIFRYFENIAPGRNGGGWVDTFGIRYLDRYAEQLWLTAFAKAPEITLFNSRLLERPLGESDRAAWQNGQNSFDFDRMVESFRGADGKLSSDLTYARAAGYALEQADAVMADVGEPIGVKSYRPHHATGEDFLHTYIGMLGIPIDLRPEFPEDATTLLLTESAAHDSEIVARIERRVRAGANVIITSGLLRALQDRGICGIAEIRATGRKTLTREFYAMRQTYEAAREIVIPQIDYLTNDTWEVIGAGANGSPLLLEGSYGKGMLTVLAIPDNYADLYALPPQVLDAIRAVIARDLPIRLEGPSQVALFLYDNDTFIVESFLPQSVDVRVVADQRFTKLRELGSGQRVSGRRRGEKTVFELQLWPHSYRAFAAE